MPIPYFNGRATGEARSPRPHRLLLVTYHFPPDSAVGGLRWERHCAHLAHHGWDVDVITRDLDQLQGADLARLRCVSDNVGIYSATEREPMISRVGRMAVQAKRWIAPNRVRVSTAPVNAHEIRPNKRLGLVRAHAAMVHIAKQTQWANEAISIGRDLLGQGHYDVVASSGPPHMAHEAARTLAVEAKIPLVIDLRDPWAGWKRVPEDFASPLWLDHAHRHERRAVHDARLVVMNTDPARDDLISRYPWACDRVITVWNGSDDDLVPPTTDAGRFTIRFAGTIYLDRDPRLVFRGAAIAVRRLGLTPNEFSFEFIGDVGEFGGQSLLAIAAEEGLGGFVSVGGRQPRADAMRFLAGATMLLSLPQDADLCVPAKIFEYTKFNAWLLTLATERSATAKVLAESGADVVDPLDVARIAEVIEARVLEYRETGRPSAVGADGRFDRRHQADVLVQRLESLLSPDRRIVDSRTDSRVGAR